MKTATFSMNGKQYVTDQETLGILRDIIPKAKNTGDMSAVIAVMSLGEISGRITETKPQP